MVGRIAQRLRRLEVARRAERERRAESGSASRLVVRGLLRMQRERRLAAMSPEERAAWEAAQAAETPEVRHERLLRVAASIREFNARHAIA